MERASQDFGRAITLAPTNPTYLYSRGLTHYESGDYSSALEDFQGAIDLQEGFTHAAPKYSNFYLSRGRTHLQLGNTESAIIDAETAIHLINAYFQSLVWIYRKAEVDLLLEAAHGLVADQGAQAKTP